MVNLYGSLGAGFWILGVACMSLILWDSYRVAGISALMYLFLVPAESPLSFDQVVFFAILPISIQGSSGTLKKSTDCRSLVLWGTNLGFTVRSGGLTKQERDMMKLPRFHFGVIIGLILSDGWLIRASARSKNCRLGFAQSLAHFKYIWFVFTILSPYCSSYPTYRIRERLDKISYSIEFFTRSLPCFTELQSKFYVNPWGAAQGRPKK